MNDIPSYATKSAFINLQRMCNEGHFVILEGHHQGQVHQQLTKTMETHGIIIIDSSIGKITVMHSTHNSGDNENIRLALQRYEETKNSKSSNYEWMEFQEPLTLHNL